MSSSTFFTQKKRSQQLGPLSQGLGCWVAYRGCCVGLGGWSSAGRGWESGYLWAWTSCLGPGAGPGLAEAGGWVSWAGAAVAVEGAAAAGRSVLGRPTPTQCSCRPAPWICLSVGAARSCSKWGRWCSGWRKSGSSVGSGPPRTRCRCPVMERKQGRDVDLWRERGTTLKCFHVEQLEMLWLWRWMNMKLLNYSDQHHQVTITPV